ncbi:AAA family ATPase [Candidatus Woesebacteria bacterium]|nr:AAA family ATPase [Candidatus Woesebacteria bacterium]
MIITGLWLQHFRNISDHTWSFEPGLNVFTAPNGSGKSNLIESLALLSTGQSWRAKQTDELIEWDEELARVMAKFQDEKGDETKLEQLFTHGILQGKKNE